MDNKVTSPAVKGIIISLCLIVFSLILTFSGLEKNKGLGAIQFLILIGGIIWAAISFANQMNNNVTFGSVFVHGFKTAAAITATIPPGTCPAINTPLALEWLYFRGQPSRQSIVLDWGTTANMNSGYFTLGKSIDGKNFETLAIVNAEAKTGKAEHSYSFTDHQPYAGRAYYRISHTDLVGNITHFRTIEAEMASAPGTTTHHVAGGQIHIQYSGTVSGSAAIHLYSTDGRRVASQPVLLTGHGSESVIDAPGNPGMYLLYLESRGEKLYGAKVFVD